jgi:GxxExxY protein
LNNVKINKIPANLQILYKYTNAMTKENKVIYKELSYKIVGVLFDVYNELGYGHKEKYYEEAIAQCFTQHKIKFKRQLPFVIRFRDKIVGKYFLDFLVEEKIVLEIKKGDYFSRKNITQVKEYLAITKMKLAILANFTSTGVKFHRVLNG